MPTVPTLAPLQQVQDRPAAPAYQTGAGATPQAFGSNVATNLADLGQGATTAGNDALSIATQQQVLDNERALKQADVALASKISAITYGDGTAQNPGYFSQRGDNAVSQAPSTVAAIKQAHDDVMATLPNARTQSMFSTIGAGRVNSATQSIGGFLDQQRLVANVGASQGRMGQAVSDAALAWNDPTVRDKSLTTINSEVQAQGQLQGWSPDETKEKLIQAQTTFYKTVVSSAGNTGNFQAAAAIIQAGTKDGTLPGAALPAIETDLHTAERYARFDQDWAKQQAKQKQVEADQKTADNIFKTSFDPNSGQSIIPQGIGSAINNSGIHWQMKEELLGAINRNALKSDQTMTAPGLLHTLAMNSMLPDGDPNKTTMQTLLPHIGVDLSNTDYNQALGFTKPEKLGETQMIAQGNLTAKGMLVPNYTPGLSALTTAQQNQFLRLDTWMYPALQQGVAEGKSIASQLKPGDPNYIFTPDAMKQFAPTGDDVSQGWGIQQKITSALAAIKNYASGPAVADPLDTNAKAVVPGKPAAPGGLPGVGPMDGDLHLRPDIAPQVPDGAARPFAPGEYIRNKAGSWSSEISTTVEQGDHPELNGGKPTVIPTLWVVDGKAVRVSEDKAVNLAVKSGLPFNSFNTNAEAEKFSQDREDSWQPLRRPEDATSIASLWSPKAKLGKGGKPPLSDFFGSFGGTK